MLLPMTYFDKVNCVEGIKALSNYHRKWNSRYNEYEDNPVKDWSAHASDAFRYLAIGHSLPRKRTKKSNLIRHYKRFSTNSWQTA